MTRPILFLTDYGLDDEYVGVCHAAIARLAPEVRVIDLTHGIPAHDVLAGALALAATVPYAPGQAVYLAVVDPGVGTERRGVALAAGDAWLVGPDNGLLMEAADALGGVREARAIDPGAVAPWPVSATFHGRDVFAPAAARLALGSEGVEVGPEADIATLEPPPVPELAAATGSLLIVGVLGVDRFGNVRLGVRPRDLRTLAAGASRLEVEVRGRREIAHLVRTFGEIPEGELGLLEDSAGHLALCRNLGRAADSLGLKAGERVVIRTSGVG